MFKQSRYVSIAALLAAACLTSACDNSSGGGGPNPPPPPPVNGAPTVSIEFADATVPRTELSNISMTAVASDPDGDTLSYAWTQIAGPAVDLEGNTTATLTFTAPNVDDDVTLEFEVAVNDAHQHIVKARQAVLVTEADGLAFTTRSQVNNSTQVFFNLAAPGSAEPVRLHPELAGTASNVNVLDFTALPGGRVAYRMNKDGGDIYRAYVANVDGSGERDVTGTLAAGGSVEQLIVSPIGEHIALFGDLETDGVDELFVVPASSPDGQDRVKVSGEITASDGNPDNGEIDGIVLGGSSRENYPVWSPQGGHIAFVGDLTTDNDFTLYVASISDRSRHALSDILNPGLCDAVTCPLEGIFWAPNSDHVAFSGVLRGLEWELYVAKIDGSDQRSLSHPDGPPAPGDKIIDEFGSRNEIVWSPSGTHIAYSKETGLHLATLDATPPRLLNARANAHTAYPIAWSTDGATLAFIGVHPTHHNSLYLLDVTSPTAEPRHVGLTSTDAFVSGPDSSGLVWSPDGSHLAYIEENDAEHKQTLLILPADSTDGSDHLAVALPDGFSARMPAWSPTGTHLAFTGRTSMEEEEEEEEGATLPIELYVVGAAGDNLRKVSGPFAAPNAGGAGPEGVSQFRWSPNGSQLAFTGDIEQVLPPGADEAESLGLYVVPTVSADGSDRIRVSHAPIDNTGDGVNDNQVSEFAWLIPEQ